MAPRSPRFETRRLLRLEGIDPATPRAVSPHRGLGGHLALWWRIRESSSWQVGHPLDTLRPDSGHAALPSARRPRPPG